MLQTLIYGLAIFGGLSLLWLIYKAIVPEPVDLLPEVLSEPFEAGGSAGFLTALAANLNVGFTDDNRIEHYRNGCSFFPAMLDAIEAARTSINFVTFVYWTGPIAEKFADALAEAAGRGVEVRVLLDYVGCRPMPKELVRRMEDSGCRVAYFHEIKPFTLRRFNHRTHRKVLVTDGCTGFTGGAGIAEEWTGDARGPDEWRDDHFKIEGPAVRDLQGAFGENWRQATGEVLTGPEAYPELEPRGSSRVVPLFGTPEGPISAISFCYWLALKSAGSHVFIETPYFTPDPDLVAALQQAARRGVDVRLLLPGDKSDYPIVRWAAQSYYKQLLEAGVRIFEFQPTMLHTKVVTVDGDLSVIGSANFDSRSLELNYEIALAVQDGDLARRLEASFQDDLDRSREITRGDVQNWPSVSRLRARIFYAFREQL